MTKNADFLLVDAGNTRVKWALAARSGFIRQQGSIATSSFTFAEVAKLARRYPARQIVLACVVPRLMPAFRRAFAERLFIVEGRALAKLGLEFDYPKPQEIGADRLAVAIVMQEERRWPAIAISCGTATAFTVLDAKGKVCGGVIAPGVRAQLGALLGTTAQLPEIRLRAPRSAVARSTGDAMRSGVLHGFRGGVREIVRQLSRAVAGRRAPRLLLTGGDASYLANLDGLRMELRPLLVFEGLRIIGNRAFPESS